MDLAYGFEQTEFHEQAFEFFDFHGLGHDEHFVVVDVPSQGTVFVGLGRFGVPFDDGFLADFRTLHVIVSGNEVNHFRAQAFGEFFDHFFFVV